MSSATPWILQSPRRTAMGRFPKRRTSCVHTEGSAATTTHEDLFDKYQFKRFFGDVCGRGGTKKDLAKVSDVEALLAIRQPPCVVSLVDGPHRTAIARRQYAKGVEQHKLAMLDAQRGHTAAQAHGRRPSIMQRSERTAQREARRGRTPSKGMSTSGPMLDGDRLRGSEFKSEWQVCTLGNGAQYKVNMSTNEMVILPKVNPTKPQRTLNDISSKPPRVRYQDLPSESEESEDAFTAPSSLPSAPHVVVKTLQPQAHNPSSSSLSADSNQQMAALLLQPLSARSVRPKSEYKRPSATTRVLSFKPSLFGISRAFKLSSYLAKQCRMKVCRDTMVRALVVPPLRAQADAYLWWAEDKKKEFSSVGDRLQFNPSKRGYEKNKRRVARDVLRKHRRTLLSRFKRNKQPQAPRVLKPKPRARDAARLFRDGRYLYDFSPIEPLDERTLVGLLERDWVTMQLMDVLPDRADRDAVKTVLLAHYETVARMFDIYASRVSYSGIIGCMGGNQWGLFCKECKLVGGLITMNTPSIVFHRVNVDEEFVVSESAHAMDTQHTDTDGQPYLPHNNGASIGKPIPSPPNSIRLAEVVDANEQCLSVATKTDHADMPTWMSSSARMRRAIKRRTKTYEMRLKDDPDNPDRHFTRSEFMEAIVRIALIKFANSTSHYTSEGRYMSEEERTAVEKTPTEMVALMMQKHVVPYASGEDVEVRARLMDAPVQVVFRKYKKSLFKYFQRWVDPSEPVHWQTTLTSVEYGQLIQDLFRKGVAPSRRMCFLAYAMAKDLKKSTEYLEYYEWLECVGRLAFYKYKSSGLPGGLAGMLSKFLELVLGS